MDGVLSLAKTQDRPILVLFTPAEPDRATRQLYETTLADADNRKAIEDADLILVHVPLANVKASEPARRYEVEDLPTMLLLAPDGSQRKRRVGTVPKELFRLDFLGAVTPRARP